MCESGKYLDIQQVINDYPREVVSRTEYHELADRFSKLYRASVWSLAVKTYRNELERLLDEYNDFYIQVRVD